VRRMFNAALLKEWSSKGLPELAFEVGRQSVPGIWVRGRWPMRKRSSSSRGLSSMSMGKYSPSAAWDAAAMRNYSNLRDTIAKPSA
jgi:hypothetical protein